MATQNAVATFLLAVDEGGSVHGFSSEDNPQADVMLRAAAERSKLPVNLVRIDMPLPAGSGSATVTVLDS